MSDVHESALPGAEELAAFFHATYEAIAPSYGYKTRRDSAVPWADVPEANKRLMIAVCEKVLANIESRLRDASHLGTDPVTTG